MAKINKTDRKTASKDLEQLKLSYITGENAKNTTTLKNSDINSTPRYLPKRKKNLCLHKDWYVNVYSVFIPITVVNWK